MGEKYDIAVIGGGPGGYTAAAEGAAAGFRTALIESQNVGGTCLHRGCIPTKTLMHTSELIRLVNEGVPGMQARDVSNGRILENLCAGVDLQALQTRRQEVSSKLEQGVAAMLKKSGVTVFHGKGTITAPGSIHIRESEDRGAGEEIQADKIIIATGSRPGGIPVPGADLEGVMDSDAMFGLARCPDELIIAGGGVIGIEFATIFNDLGIKVTILEGASRLLAPLDREFSQRIKMVLKKRGVDIHTGAMVQRFEKQADGRISCIYTEKDAEQQASAEAVLVAAGRRPELRDLLGDGVSLEMNGPFLSVDEKKQTSCPGIYAIGDVTGGIQLAHAAQAEARNLIAALAGRPPEALETLIPSCVYTDPEIAFVGLTLDEAKAQGIQAVSRKLPVAGNAKSVLSGKDQGFMKAVVEESTGKIIGAQFMCARATDMIGEMAAAMAAGMTVAQLKRVVHPHPTFNEAVPDLMRLF